MKRLQVFSYCISWRVSSVAITILLILVATPHENITKITLEYFMKFLKGDNCDKLSGEIKIIQMNF